jgi:hypothetical protein
MIPTRIVFVLDTNGLTMNGSVYSAGDPVSVPNVINGWVDPSGGLPHEPRLAEPSIWLVAPRRLTERPYVPMLYAQAAPVCVTAKTWLPTWMLPVRVAPEGLAATEYVIVPAVPANEFDAVIQLE